MTDSAKDRQRHAIMCALWAYGPMTYQELADETKVKLQSVCWRMKELRQQGAVRFVLQDGKIPRRNGGRLNEATYTARAG